MNAINRIHITECINTFKLKKVFSNFFKKYLVK